jgi:uncharacterized protein YjbI with pentapeptide repeats
MIHPSLNGKVTFLILRHQWNKAFSDYQEKLIPMEVAPDQSCNQRLLAEILSKKQQSTDFFDYMEQLIQMKVGEAGLDSTSSLRETEENCGDILLDQVENIITAKLKPTDGKEMLDIISEATSKISDEINQQLDSLVAQRNSINEGSGIITPPVIEEKEKSKIRTELIKIFQIDTEILKKLTAAIFQVDKQILKDHGEEIWRAISLIKSKPQDPLHYLKEFKLAMETLPLDLRSKLVPIIYEKPLRNIPDYIQRDSKNNPTLEFGPGCDLSGYYLRDLSFQPSGADWSIEADLYINESAGPLDFRSAKMIRADLSKSNFSSLVLNEADLTEADLTHTNFIGSKLIGTKLSGAYWEEGLNKRVLILEGSRVSNPYWERGQPPLIDRTTRFIPDDLLNSVGQAALPSKKLTNLISTKNQVQIGDITLPLKNNTLKNVEIIQNAFKGVTSKMKEHILNNIGPFQRRALEAILAYKDPNKKIITATDLSLILPNKEPRLIIIPEDEHESMLEAGITASNLIQEEIPEDQSESVRYNLTLINQQAVLNNLAKVSGNHTKKDFSKLGITLRGTSFDQAILDSANLSRQDLSEAVFNECRLIKTDLSGTKLQNTIFNNCDLSEVDLSKAKMQGTTFHNCNLSKSTWEKALMDGVSMINCTIKDVDIEEMTSHNWFLDHCILDNVNFKGSEDSKGILINQMGLSSSIIVNSKIEGNTDFYNVEGIGSVLAMNDPAEKLLNKDLTMSPFSYVNNSLIKIALEAVFQQGSIYSKAFQDVEDNGVNFGPIDLMDLSGLSRAAIGYQPQRFAKIPPELLRNMK